MLARAKVSEELAAVRKQKEKAEALVRQISFQKTLY